MYRRPLLPIRRFKPPELNINRALVERKHSRRRLLMILRLCASERLLSSLLSAVMSVPNLCVVGWRSIEWRLAARSVGELGGGRNGTMGLRARLLPAFGVTHERVSTLLVLYAALPFVCLWLLHLSIRLAGKARSPAANRRTTGRFRGVVPRSGD